MSFRLGCVLCLVLALAAARAEAQFVQYTAPGDFRGPAESREEQFERAMKDAKWRFGRLLVDPWIGLRNAGYQDNLTEIQESGDVAPERVDDVTASIGAGLNTYLPIGADLIWGAFVLPEYVWWQDLTERRRLNGRYGTGLFGNLGRIGLEATASRVEESQILSVEVEEPFNQQSDRANLELTVDLGKGLLAFGRGAASRFRSLEDDAAFQVLGRLDRDETIYAAGVGFLSTRGLRLGVGIEESETESLGTNLSNSGSAIVFDLQYDAPLVKVSADLALRKLDPEPGSEFVAFDGENASLNLTSRVFGPVWFDLFGRRSLSFSIQEGVSHIENEGLGAGLRTPLGSRASLRLFVEEAESTFVEGSSASTDRVDDSSSLGASLNVDLGRLSLRLGASRTEYESNFPENDRTIVRVSTVLELAGGGGGSSPWGG